MNFLINKIKKFILLIAFFVPTAIVLFFIKIFSPIKVIKFVVLDESRIGGFNGGDWGESIISRKREFSEKNIYLYYLHRDLGYVANTYWATLWKKKLFVIPFSNFVRFLDLTIRRLSFFEKHIPEEIEIWNKSLVVESLVLNKKPNIDLPKKDNKKGELILRQLGVQEKQDFICFHSRDSSYLNTVCPQKDWSYHDYRDSDIQNYLSAASSMTQEGYAAIRVGSIVEKKIQTKNQEIIDYASSKQRSEFMDIFLMSRCKFFLCSETGLNMVASSFRKPLALVNYVLFDCPLLWNESVFITKKFFFRSENRFLSFREILSSDFTKDIFEHYGDGGVYNKIGIDLIENTPQEIESATIELNKRMDGTWVETEEDKELQRAYWDLYSTDSKVHVPVNRRRINVNDKNTNFFVGAEFLRNNKFLLER